jgi:hypothetical protein
MKKMNIQYKIYIKKIAKIYILIEKVQKYLNPIHGKKNYQMKNQVFYFTFLRILHMLLIISD